MSTFIGDYTCKVDAKGRITLPSGLKKQMSASARESFVVRKDIYENCLVLYPIDQWQNQVEQLRQRLNPYNREHNTFMREFFKNSVEVELDAAGRLLLPHRLLEMVNIGSEVILTGIDSKIELWDAQQYKQGQISAEQFAILAQNILG